MERINLFRYKKPVLKFSSFLILTLSLIAPVLAMRFTLEFYKRSVINSIYLSHGRIVEKYKVSRATSLTGVITMLDSINNQLVQISKRLQAQINDLENHIKSFNDRMQPLCNILGALQKTDQDWVVLRKLIFDDSVRIDLYELYNPDTVKTADRLEKTLLDLGYKVSKNEEYDVLMQFLSKRISGVSVEGRR